MNDYGYYTFIREPYSVFRKDYPRAALWFTGPDRENVVIYNRHPVPSFAITNERLALIMEHA
ncbi:MAG: hypothetical protein LBS05_09475 [Tannerellaceae bacterium]|nr:hypothetical protein [Tannerellaceae bacterium]